MTQEQVSFHAVTERTRQQERAEKILDSAASLLLRYGYKRITIEDVANQAGIGKGSVYLHWKTKEALFGTLLLREVVAVWRELLRLFRSDPSEVQLHRVMRSMLLIIRERPLARALFNRDTELLGKLAQSGFVRRSGPAAGSQEFLTLLRSLGLVRTDMDLDMQAYAYAAVLTGFSLGDPIIEDEAGLSLEGKAEAAAQTFRRAFEPETPPTPEVLRDVVAPRMIEFLEQVCVFYEKQIQERMLP